MDTALLQDMKSGLAAVAQALTGADMDEGDVRRQQLLMRAAEKQKVEEKREENKQKKAEAKGEPKRKGRPRKVVEPPSAADAPAEHAEPSVPNRGAAKKSGERKAQRPKPEAADVGEGAPADPVPAKRQRRAKADTSAEGEVDEAWKLEMQGLLVGWKEKEYDRDTEDMHKNVYGDLIAITPYWARPAVGVKIRVEKKSGWHQVVYWSFIPHIVLGLCMARKFATKLHEHGVEWWETEDGKRFERKLRLSAAAAAVDAYLGR